MALSFINATDATADISIGGASYKTVMREFEVESNVEMIDITTFNDEGSVKQDLGRVILTMRVAGLLGKGTTIAGPLIPPPQNSATILTFSTGCTLTFTADYLRATARRTV